MFDIHDNQQVAIYNNSNNGKKENPNNSQEEIAGKNINFPSNVFCITELHHTYWKEFCDAYYSSLGFLPNENSTYEQKIQNLLPTQRKIDRKKRRNREGIDAQRRRFQVP